MGNLSFRTPQKGRLFRVLSCGASTRRVGTVSVLGALVVGSACGGNGGGPDASTDATTDAAADVVSEGALADVANDASDVTLTVTTVLNANATGSVIPAPVGVSCGPGCYRYAAGASVVLTAARGSTNAFSGWSGECAGTTSTCALVMSAARSATATFSPFNVMFVTSGLFAPATYGGLSGADAICKSAAVAAGLYSGKYVAMLSAAGADGGPPTHFIDRVPTSARGWMRTDGRPFADTMAGLFGAPHQLFYPPRLNENGADVPTNLPHPYVVTATNGAGHFDISSSDCVGYTQDDANGVSGGWAYSAYPQFTQGEGFLCTTAYRLYCFETDWYAPLAFDVPAGARLAFVTEQAFDGAKTVPGFDQSCADEALDAGLPGSYAAFVQTPDASAPSRFSSDGGTWRRPDGVLIAKTATDLLGLVAVAALQQHANGSYDSRYVGSTWTGVGATSCMGWTTNDAGASGAAGVANDTTYAFGGAYPPSCNTTQPVYCLQQ